MFQPTVVTSRLRPPPPRPVADPAGIGRRLPVAALIAAVLLAGCDGGSAAEVPPAVDPAGSAATVARSDRFELRRDAVRPGRAEATARSERFLLIRE